MSDKIIFYNVDFNVKLEEMQEFLVDDEKLIKAILWCKDKLEKENIETWLVDRNMIVTEQGYKLAVTEQFSKDIENAKKAKVN